MHLSHFAAIKYIGASAFIFRQIDKKLFIDW